MSDPADLTLRAAAEQIAAGELSPVELAAACLERARCTEDLGAFACLDVEGTRTQAAALTRELAAAPPRGPLHGIPVAIKDVIDVRGLPTRAGSTLTEPTPAERDATIVARLRAAGAIILGKTTTDEFAFGVSSRQALNPLHLQHIAGGSSGGSAVAVAACVCPLAIGTDTAGSIRIPAACCQVAGLAFPSGTWPLDGVWPLARSFDTIGLLARDADDIAVAASALCGPSRVRTVRTVAMPGQTCIGSIDDDLLSATEEALARLISGGAARLDVDVPSFQRFAGPRARIVGAEALEAHRAQGWFPAKAQSYGASVRAQLVAASATSPETVRCARRELEHLVARFRIALQQVDVLVTPTLPVAPPLRGAEMDDPVASELRPIGLLTRLCFPVNAAGAAAISVPSHGGGGGIQLIARHTAVAVAAARSSGIQVLSESE